MRRRRTPLLITTVVLFGCGSSPHLVHDVESRSGAAVHVVVEIPAGDNAKYEVNKTSGRLEWQQQNGRPRVIDYLPYPGNYGFIPRTLSPKNTGGDGDPLDVLVLGPSQPRGEVIEVYLIGVLKLLDEGEQDDKIIAIPTPADESRITPLSHVRSLDELNEKCPGIGTIIEVWFSNYDGVQTTEIAGWGDEKEAAQILEAAEQAYLRSTK